MPTHSWFRSAFLIVIMSGLLTMVGHAQNTMGRVSVAVTYKADLAGLNTGVHKFWMQGGSAEISAPLYRGLGIIADVTGLHTSDAGTGIPFNLVTTTFGPRYT